MNLNSNSLFSETSITVTDGSEKRNRWLNLELQSLHFIERRSKSIVLNKTKRERASSLGYCIKFMPLAN